ncbi:MAG TPA: NAD(P)-dependent alcohol dehydrogenase [Candidatus Dormibacteraeota bacterium]|nr:NAD(P)-dependent alcohol dehydrogenase [Candidatus Dormibacteraeota bacterium]
MKAAWHDRYGEPDVVDVRDIPTQVPVDDQVLVKVRAASVNRADLDWLLPKSQLFRVFTGVRAPRRHRLGLDVAGVVEAVGPTARRFETGAAVFADLFWFGHGSFAEYVCAPERAFQTMPEGMSFEDAATLPHAALLAVQGMRPRHGQAVGPGSKVLIVGASGNVGPFAVQIAKHLGAEVTGVCRTEKMDFVRSLGADHVVDYTTTDYTKTGQYDWIIDVDAHRSILGFIKALRANGVYQAMGGNRPWILSLPVLALSGWLIARGKHLGLMGGWRAFAPSDVDGLKGFIAAGVIQPRIDQRFPLADVREALRAVHEGRAKGKVVITV